MLPNGAQPATAVCDDDDALLIVDTDQLDRNLRLLGIEASSIATTRDH